MAREISKFKGSAKGVKTMSLDKKDSILDFTLTTDKYAGLDVETNRGAREIVRASIKQFALSSRGNKGRLITQRGHLIRSYRAPIEIRFEAFGDESSEE
jgi:DNA gyrase subunit A